MKKLIIAAAIVCAAAMTHASLVSWGLSGKAAFDGTNLGGQKIELWMVGVNGKADTLIDTRYTLSNPPGAAGNLSAATDSSSYDYRSTVAGGAVAKDNGDGTWSDLGREYFIKLVHSDGGTEYTYTSSAKASSGLNETKPGSLSFSITDTKSTVAGTKDAWVSAVPEPTSGLLLLLGVAGLALKRRRA